MACEPEALGPVERELVRMLRSLDLTEVQPGVRERCWQEFRELADLPDAPPPVDATRPAELRQLPSEPEAPGQTDRRGTSTPAKVPAKFRARPRTA
jgi:hypothetical protein